jgi:hypothetical protein
VTRTDPDPPDQIVAAARARAGARAARDWARADALRGEIEAAGWKVVDHGTGFRLVPAAAPTMEEDGVVRYGSAAAVPSVLAEPPEARFTVELVAEEWPHDLARLLAGLRTHAPDGTQVVIVANDPTPGQAARLAAGAPDLAPIAGTIPEVVWTSERLGHAAARNVGLQRARGAVIVLADTSVEPDGDPLGPLEAALEDPTVAVAGPVAFVTADLRRFEDAPGPDADAVGLYWLAFRRADFVALGPLDEKFGFYRNLDIWWSLVLRAGPATEDAPRRGRRVALPITLHEHRGWTGLPEDERDRLSKRNFYRVLDRFRDRRDLLSGASPAGRPAPRGGSGS